MNATMTLSEILQIEKTVSEMIQQIRQQLVSEVKETQVPDVHKLSENTFVVKLSALKQHDVWSPEYYNNVTQADLIVKAFQNVKTTSDFITKMKDIIENRCVKIHSSGYTVTYRLNDTTISIIQKYYEDAEVNWYDYLHSYSPKGLQVYCKR